MLFAVGSDSQSMQLSVGSATNEVADQPCVRLILSRRSHRVGFDSDPVPRELLLTIARCGLAAPSSKNAQPWRLHVVTDQSLIQEIADGVAAAPGARTYVPSDPTTGRPRPNWDSTVLESAEILRGAPAAIFVENLGRFSGGRVAVAGVPREALFGTLIAYTLECMGLGAAVENMWLSAEALGLKVAFLGDVGVDEDRIRSRLAMTGDLVGVLALGCSDLDPEVKRAVDDDLDRIRWHEGEGTGPSRKSAPGAEGGSE